MNGPLGSSLGCGNSLELPGLQFLGQGRPLLGSCGSFQRRGCHAGIGPAGGACGLRPDFSSLAQLTHFAELFQ